MLELGRLITAMVTPFDNRGGVDYEQAKKLALALLDSGSDGVVVVGTTGESPTLVREEEIRLFDEVKSAVGDSGTVIAGTGSNSTAEAISATREAERVGVDACLLVVPYYNKPTQQGLIEHFKAVAGSTSLPCILYNVPSRTVTNLSAETAIELSRIDNVVGLKEASGDIEQAVSIMSGAGKGFVLYSGNDNDTLPLMSRGGYGVISVASHLVGNQMKEMINKAISGDIEQAGAIHNKLLPLFDAMFIVSNPIPIKYALNRIGFPVGKPRLPLTPPDEKAAAAIDAVLKDYNIDLPLN